jgi:Protein of unknown function (DUF2442)
MMPRVAKVAPPSQYRLHVEFDDGVAGTIDLSPELDGEVFQPLGDEAVFRQVTVDEFGAVCWPNGPELAPDTMHSELTGKPPPQSTTAGEGRTPRRRETATRPLSGKPTFAAIQPGDEVAPIPDLGARALGLEMERFEAEAEISSFPPPPPARAC